MKILYPLLCYFPSEAGGPANTIYWLNKSLGKKGIKSFVISSKYGLKQEIINYDELYYKFNIFPTFANNSIFSFITRKNILKIKEIDIIHFSSLFFKPTIFYIIIGLLFSKKIIISPRGELYPPALERKKKYKLLYIKSLSFFQKKINFHSTNPEESKFIKLYFPKACSIIELPNYIELPRKLNVKTKNQILILGRINPIKNIDIIIHAFKKLPRNLQNKFKLIIAGEATLNYEKEYLKTLKSLVDSLEITPNVEFTGGIYGKEKEILLAESYSLILPSKSENFGNVVLESLSQGTPAIVSKKAPWSVLEKSNAGFWVEPTEKELLVAMKKLMGLDKKSYNSLRENALNLAKTNFDIERNINKWINYYKNIK